MAKVFISGCVSDATVHGPMRGLEVQASVGDSSKRHVLWQGISDADGTFGFELRAAHQSKPRHLFVEVHHGNVLLAESKVEWQTLQHAGTHVELKVTERLAHPHGEPLSLRFPIGFPGADRPAEQRGPVQLELQQPGAIPTSAMAALPFMIQRSRPTDPEEGDEGSDDARRTVAHPRSSSDPP